MAKGACGDLRVRMPPKRQRELVPQAAPHGASVNPQIVACLACEAGYTAARPE